MLAGSLDANAAAREAANRELGRVLSSPRFLRNERMSRFLRFLVEHQLDGEQGMLKESVIAIEVFGRKPDHDPSQDSIVRTEAGRLRSRLAEYYLAEGKGDSIVIDLPKGGYMPVFHHRDLPRESKPPAPKTRWRTWLVATAIILIIVVAAVAGWRMLHNHAPIAIAVLPLENLNHDPASDYLADGLTDELIRNLSLIEGLSPRSRTSSFAFKDKPRNLRQIGKELNVAYVVEGSVLRIGNQLRVDAELVRVRDDFSLWSGRYDRTFTDVFAIQDQISIGIVNSLRLELGRGRRRYETSTEAYDLYLQARALGVQHGWAGEVRSIDRFQEAIAKDPAFAPAYAGLASALVTRSGAAGGVPPGDLAAMQPAAEKAIELDPLLAEAHGALGMVYARQAQWERSEKSFRRALELDPNDSVIYGNFALDLLFPLNRVPEAVRELRIGVKNDPLAPRLRYIFANILIAARRFDEAAAYCLSLPPSFEGKNSWLARARLGQGRVQEAIHLLEGPDAMDGIGMAVLGYAYGRAGRRNDAEKMAARLHDDPFSQAMTFMGMGDKERAVQALQRMESFGPARVGRNLNYPEFAAIRGDPRLKALRRKLGLPE